MLFTPSREPGCVMAVTDDIEEAFLFIDALHPGDFNLLGALQKQLARRDIEQVERPYTVSVFRWRLAEIGSTLGRLTTKDAPAFYHGTEPAWAARDRAAGTAHRIAGEIIAHLPEGTPVSHSVR